MNTQVGIKAFNEQLKAVNDNAVNFQANSTKKKEYEQLRTQLIRKVNERRAKAKENHKLIQNGKKRNETLEMIKQNIPVHRNLISPRYELDDRLNVYREVNVPSASLFMAIGYDGALTSSMSMPEKESMPETRNRHYRKIYHDELENNKEIFKQSIFCNAPILRGQERGADEGFFKSLFSSPKLDESGQVSSLREVGQFKGYLCIHNDQEDTDFDNAKKQKMSELDSVLNELHQKKFGVPMKMDDQTFGSNDGKHQFKRRLMDMEIYTDDLMDVYTLQYNEDFLLKQLHSTKACAVRLYVLEAFDLASRDIGSDSDPYLYVKCGSFTYNGQDKYQQDQPNPKYHQAVEFNATFPGSPALDIELWDYDDMFGDDLIGKTTMDLDERQYCVNWRQMEDKPVEYRELYHQSSSMSQGSVICWLDIEETNKKKQATKVWDVTPEPEKDYQLRVAVYDAKNVPVGDLEGTSDVFVKATFNNEAKETDTHWRCTTSTASFNYRLLFDFKAPNPKPDASILRLQLFDRDLFKPNDFLCEFVLDLDLLVRDCRATAKPMHLNKKYFNTHFKDAYAKSNQHPEIEVTFED